jgi:hypothetical protein
MRVLASIVALLAIAHATETQTNSRVQEKLRQLVLSEVKDQLAESFELVESENFFDDLRNRAEDAKRQAEEAFRRAEEIKNQVQQRLGLAETEAQTKSLTETENFFDDLRNKAEEAKR